MPRIMTWQVRQALAESARGDRVASADSAPSSDAEGAPGEVLLPCAPPRNGTASRKRKHDEASRVEMPQVTWTQESIPEDLRKYWHQRHRLFSLFDSGVHLDRESWYSCTPERVAQQIAERCRCDVIVDAFCGAGGNAIQFAMTCAKVIAIDIDPVKIALARHNAALYDVDDTIEFICADFVEWAKGRPRGSADVVFLSPPWGGVDYQRLPRASTDGSAYPGSYPLSALTPLPGKELFDLARRITPDVAMYLPRSVDVGDIGKLAAPDEVVEVEEAWMGRNCKAVTALFGGLVAED